MALQVRHAEPADVSTEHVGVGPAGHLDDRDLWYAGLEDITAQVFRSRCGWYAGPPQRAIARRIRCCIRFQPSGEKPQPSSVKNSGS